MKLQNRAIVTLTTDFGWSDGYAGIVKGVILSIARDAIIVDLTHDVPAWDIAAGAWVIGSAYQFFPPDSIHLVVIDPEVGAAQRGVILFGPSGTFVGPDNGVFSCLLEDNADWKAHALTQSNYWLSTVSGTFHARDIYGPVCGHIASGTKPHEIGEPVDLSSLIRIPMQSYHRNGKEIRGEVVYIDHFGNLITNIPGSYLTGASKCFLMDCAVGAVGKNYSAVSEGNVSIFCGSHGRVEIGVFKGRACDILKAQRGAQVRLEIKA